MNRREFLRLAVRSSRVLAISAIGYAVIQPTGLKSTVVRADTLGQESSSPPLRELASAIGLDLGVSLTLVQVPGMLDLMAREFSLGRITYDLRWDNLEPVRGQLQFKNPAKYSDADRLFNFCTTNSMKIHVHSLLYSAFFPEWLRSGQFSAQELRDIIRSHIGDLFAYANGRVELWAVLNELIPAEWSGAISKRPDPFLRALGPEYVDFAFQVARELDSSTQLIYNDAKNHLPGTLDTTKTKAIVDRLKAQGLIDGVGLQMHLDGSQPPAKQDVIDTMRSYGVPVHVTEFDVNLRNVPGDRDERFAKQAQIYREMLEAARESGVCKSFSFFTVGDKYSWLELDQSQPESSPQADATPFDDDLSPKPAYFALRDSLSH
jgi:endo-1,4-beta-xylanase